MTNVVNVNFDVAFGYKLHYLIFSCFFFNCVIDINLKSTMLKNLTQIHIIHESSFTTGR